MTVKDFIEKHPEASLDIMSSSGYISLTPGMAKELLAGKPVKADPGAEEYFRVVKPDEILSQHIFHISQSPDAWDMITGFYSEGFGSQEEKLKHRLKEAMQIYQAEMSILTPTELFVRAKEIAATQTAFEELTENAHSHHRLELLYSQEAPLTFARDALLEFQNVNDYLPQLDAALQMHETSLMMKKAQGIADFIVGEGCTLSDNGTWGADYCSLEKQFGVTVSENNGMGQLILNALAEHDEIRDLDMGSVGYEMELYLNCCSNLSDDMLEELREEEKQEQSPDLTI